MSAECNRIHGELDFFPSLFMARRIQKSNIDFVFSLIFKLYNFKQQNCNLLNSWTFCSFLCSGRLTLDGLFHGI